jgi:hypothetical protein
VIASISIRIAEDGDPKREVTTVVMENDQCDTEHVVGMAREAAEKALAAWQSEGGR